MAMWLDMVTKVGERNRHQTLWDPGKSSRIFILNKFESIGKFHLLELYENERVNVI